jgi:hypothetical protein
MIHQRSIIALAAAATVAIASTVAYSTAAHATGKTTLSSNEALGLDDNGRTLRIFELDDPDDDDLIADVSGLEGGDTRLIGIDYRVQDHLFYGVANDGGVYTLNTRTGVASKVSRLTVGLPAIHVGIDFDPSDDRLRLVGDSGDNIVHDLNTDTSANEGILDLAGVTGIAYTNNDLAEGTGTSLFDIYVPAPHVFQQTHTQNGAVVRFTGTLGLSSIGAVVGFDIQSKLSSGQTVSNTGYASLRSSNTAEPNLYKVDMLSGRATKVDDFDKQIADIAVKQP